MSEIQEGQECRPEQVFMDAQFDFCETILSLDQLLNASTLPAIKHIDSARRTKTIMDAISSGGDGEAVRAWLELGSRNYAQIQAIADERERNVALSEWQEKRRDSLAEIIKNAAESGHDVGSRIHLAVRQVRARPMPDDLIRRSVLVTLISAFEAVIGRAYRATLKRRPELYMSGEREYSLAEIVKTGSLEPLIEAAIEKKVDAALRGGLEDWEKIFIKVDAHLKKLCINWENTVEVFQRRNALIHTHGSVNSTYAAKVKNAPPVGTPLVIDDGYLRQAINQIAALGNLLILRSWLHLYPQSNFLATGVLYLYLDDFLSCGYNAAVEKMADEMKGVKNDLDVKIQMRLYAWLARKNMYGVEAIRSDLEAWDTSALKSEFAFSKAFLLGDFEGAEELRKAAAARSEPWAADVSSMAIVRFHQDK
ncbi:hypothetical protein [Streptomyces sp. NPDC047079]|uniref:hypothetical protein n=1 Tax=Streptomyces sp. NPDC047079 TaxID=3154607 RepID=UPI0033D865E7